MNADKNEGSIPTFTTKKPPSDLEKGVKKILLAFGLVMFGFVVIKVAIAANAYTSDTPRLDQDYTALADMKKGKIEMIVEMNKEVDELDKQIKSKEIDLAKSKIKDEMENQEPDMGEVERLSEKAQDLSTELGFPQGN